MTADRHRSNRSARALAARLRRGWSLAAIGLLVLANVAAAAAKRSSPGEWVSVPGAIDGAPRVEHRPMTRRGPDWKVTVAYRYRVGGTEYRRDFVRWVDEREARETAARYAAGRAVDVHHRPLSPWLSTLEPPKPWLVQWVTFAGLFLAIGLAVLIDE